MLSYDVLIKNANEEEEDKHLTSAHFNISPVVKTVIILHSTHNISKRADGKEKSWFCMVHGSRVIVACTPVNTKNPHKNWTTGLPYQHSI